MVIGLLLWELPTVALGQSDFANWESPHVSPLALTPSGTMLLAVNTADNRLEVFDLSSGAPVHVRSIAVGLEPVSVRARTETEAWVVNHVSDSISIVNVSTGSVPFTIATGDEPADVVFAGTPQRAFVSVSQLNQVRVFDPAAPNAPPAIIAIQGEDPRALAVNAAGTTVFAAIFESQNQTTLVDQQVVSLPNSPYGGQNPPPNSGNQFSPPIAPDLPPPPPVAQILRRDAAGQWRDDNNRNWSNFVAWGLHDQDVAMIDASTLAVTYATGLMTTVMQLAVSPAGMVTAVGTEALNEIRFEPNVNSIFIRVRMAAFNPSAPATVQIADLNPHLTYAVRTLPAEQRAESLGDPRGIAWHPSGEFFYVAGMGSNNVIVADPSGARLGRIDVGQGPTGLAMDAAGARLYVLNRFEASISVIDTATNAEIDRVAFFDPTPPAIRLGRPMLYDTHQTSGLGQAACASCHIDGRMDGLAWDLGDPTGEMKEMNQTCRQGPGECADWHPMKGPMVTQSLQGIVGNGPMHWRGDRANLAEFNVAFTGLQGLDAMPSDEQMQQFTDFVATILYPPSPFRNLDGTLPTAVPTQTGTGNADNGMNVFRNQPILGGALTCVACHALPTGTDQTIDFPGVGPTPQSLKVAQLRGMNEKTGFSRQSLANNRGFGFNHHSDRDTLFALLNGPGFVYPPGPPGQQMRRDLEALMLAFTNDTHAAVGQQVTFNGPNNNNAQLVARLNLFLTLADSQQVGLVAKRRLDGVERGYTQVGGGVMQSDRAADATTATVLRTSAGPGQEVTFTAVVWGTQTRIGIDRDADGAFDQDEIENCGDPVDASVLPRVRGDLNADSAVNAADVPVFVAVLVNPAAATPQQRCTGDLNADGVTDGDDLRAFVACVVGGACP